MKVWECSALKSDRCLLENHLTRAGKFLGSADWDLNGKHSPEREQVALRRPGSPGWFQTGAFVAQPGSREERGARENKAPVSSPGKTVVRGWEGALTSPTVPGP